MNICPLVVESKAFLKSIKVTSAERVIVWLVLGYRLMGSHGSVSYTLAMTHVRLIPKQVPLIARLPDLGTGSSF